MRLYLNLFFLNLIYISCYNDNVNKEKITQKINDSQIKSKPNNVIKITNLSSDFMKENKIFEWSAFQNFKEAIEDLSKLNTKGTLFFLADLSKITNILLQSSFPPVFNKPHIYGRVKVVHSQIIKSHYYASKNDNKNLNHALDNLYLEYNILLNRMISIAEQDEVFLNDKLYKSNFNHDFKVTPTLSRN